MDPDPDPGGLKTRGSGSVFFGGLKDLDPDPGPSINKPKKLLETMISTVL
jgi:hypothetical protein